MIIFKPTEQVYRRDIYTVYYTRTQDYKSSNLNSNIVNKNQNTSDNV